MTNRRQPVTLTNLVILVLDTKRFPGFRAGDQLECFLVVSFQGGCLTATLASCPQFIGPTAQCVAAAESLGINSLGRIEVANFEGRVDRIVFDGEGCILRTVETRTTWPHRLRDLDVRWHGSPVPQFPGDDRSEGRILLIKWNSLGLPVGEIRGVTGQDPVPTGLVRIITMTMAAEDGELVDDL